MKRICIDARMIDFSGIGTYLRNLLWELRGAPCDISLLIHPRSIEGKGWLSVFDLLFCTAPIYSIKEQIKLPLWVPQCDLFWTPHFNIPLVPIRAKKRLVTVHDMYHFKFLSSLRFRERVYAKTVFKRAIIGSNKIITVSNFSASEIVKYIKISKEKIQVIHNGVNLNNFFPLKEQEKEKMRRKYKLPKKFFLFVGNIKSHKNIGRLIEAYKIFLSQNRDVFLVIVGKRRGFKNIEKISSSKREIMIMEEVEDVSIFYQLATALIFPSIYEGFGLVPLEAMACGCPCVVSNILSLKEVCGKDALFIDPLDINDIVRGMFQIFNDTTLREKLIVKGKKRVAKFSWKRSAAEHMEIIKEILDENSHST